MVIPILTSRPAERTLERPDVRRLPPGAPLVVTPTSSPPGPAPTVRRLIGEQALVMAAQGVSGLGNFAFLLIALHQLAASRFAQLATFLALYLLVLLPVSGLSAGSSASPGAGAAGMRRGLVLGGGVAAVLVAATPALAPQLHLSPWLLVVLAAALPGTAPLALARGRLYGESRVGAVTATLLVEPVVRLTVGVALLFVFGAIGGAIGVVAGGYSALAVARTRGRPAGAVSVAARPRLPWPTVAAFFGIAVLQSQDLVFANGLLRGDRAGAFAALSTLGGIAAFATANIPLVLMPRAARNTPGGQRATRVALTFAVVVGLAIVIVVGLAPSSLLTHVVGKRYAGITTLTVPYLGAMALLGVARVVVARLVALRRSRLVVGLVGLAVVIQATAICLAPRTVRGVALSTLGAVSVLTVGLAATTAWDASAARRQALSRSTIRVAIAVTSIAAVGVVLRLFITRGLWVDEATSVTQARMPYGQMLQNLRTTDVHPPGYFTLLWGWVRVFGSGPLSVRMPSIILGVALVPVLYHVGRDLYGRRTGLIVAAFAAVAPQLVWYSQEARMYGLFMMLVTLSVWAQLRALRSGSARAWLVHGVLSAAMVYTQYFTGFVILAQQLVTLTVLVSRLRHRRPVGRLLLGWAGALAVVAVLVLPLVPFALTQFSANQAGGRGFGAPSTTARQFTQPGGNTLSPYVVLANLLWAIWGYHSNRTMTALGALWPAGMLLALALLGRGRSRTTIAALVVAILPIAAMFAIGMEKRFLFDLRYFIGCVPLLLLVGARAVATWPKTRVGAGVLAAVVTSTLVVGLADQQLNGSNPRRYDFQPALQRIAAAAGPRDDVILAPEFMADLAHYYQPGLHTVAGTSPTRAVLLTSSDEHVFILGSFFDVGGEKQQIAHLLHGLSAHRRLVHRWNFSNVKVWEFA